MRRGFFIWPKQGKNEKFRKFCKSPRLPTAMQTPTSPSDAVLDLLEGFFTRFDQSAVAHAREELTAEEIASLKAFAKGDLNDTERKALIPLLAHNTTALEYLAGLLKARPLT
jgi:hypothetical protein